MKENLINSRDIKTNNRNEKHNNNNKRIKDTNKCIIFKKNNKKTPNHCLISYSRMLRFLFIALFFIILNTNYFSISCLDTIVYNTINQYSNDKADNINSPTRSKRRNRRRNSNNVNSNTFRNGEGIDKQAIITKLKMKEQYCLENYIPNCMSNQRQGYIDNIMSGDSDYNSSIGILNFNNTKFAVLNERLLQSSSGRIYIPKTIYIDLYSNLQYFPDGPETPEEPSSSSSSDSNTEVPSSSSSDTDTEVPSGSSSETDTEVPSSSSSETDTEVPSSSSSETDTEVPSSSSSDTDTEVPSSSETDTEVPSSSETDTEVPSSSTDTEVPSSSETDTEVPSSSSSSDTSSDSSIVSSSSPINVDSAQSILDDIEKNFTEIINNSTANSSEKNEAQGEVIKDIVDVYHNVNTTNTTTTNTTVVNDYSGLQLNNNLTDSEMIEIALKYRLSIIILTEDCKTKIRTELDIESIMYKILDLKTASITGNNGIYHYHNTFFTLLTPNGTNIDINKYCYNDTVIIKQPSNTSSSINADYINEMLNNGIDIFNNQSAFYTDRCYIFKNLTTGDNIPLSKRNSLFPTNSYECSKGCNFTGFDTENDYTKCLCSVKDYFENKNSNSTEFDIFDNDIIDTVGQIINGLDVVNAVIDTLSNTNTDVFLCFYQAFSYKIIFKNAGFYYGFATLLIVLTAAYFSVKYSRKKAYNYLDLIEIDRFYYSSLIMIKSNIELKAKKKLIEERNLLDEYDYSDMESVDDDVSGDNNNDEDMRSQENSIEESEEESGSQEYISNGNSEEENKPKKVGGVDEDNINIEKKRNYNNNNTNKHDIYDNKDNYKNKNCNSNFKATYLELQNYNSEKELISHTEEVIPHSHDAKNILLNKNRYRNDKSKKVNSHSINIASNFDTYENNNNNNNVNFTSVNLDFITNDSECFKLKKEDNNNRKKNVCNKLKLSSPKVVGNLDKINSNSNSINNIRLEINESSLNSSQSSKKNKYDNVKLNTNKPYSEDNSNKISTDRSKGEKVFLKREYQTIKENKLKLKELKSKREKKAKIKRCKNKDYTIKASSHGLPLSDEFVDINNLQYKDIKIMKFEEVLEYDNRGFFSYLWDLFKNKSEIYFVFFSRSYLKSKIINIQLVFLKLTLQFTLNALFYTDSVIEAQADGNEGNNNWTFVYQKQLAKLVFSAVLSNVPIFPLTRISIIPDRVLRKYNEDLLSKNALFIKSSCQWIDKMMFPRYVFITSVCAFLHLICWYYNMCFCAIYDQASINWIYSAIQTMIIDLFITSNVIITFHTIIRHYARKKYENNKIKAIEETKEKNNKEDNEENNTKGFYIFLYEIFLDYL